MEQAEQMGQAGPVPTRGRSPRTRLRRAVTYLLVVAFGLFLPITFVINWTHNTILDTEGWLRTVGPIASLPAVTDAVGSNVSHQVVTTLDVETRIANALPSKAAFLAGPITTGAKGFVQEGVTKAVQSQAFQTLWLAANRFAHRQLVEVLTGRSRSLTTTNDQVVLNLVPVLNTTLRNLGGFVSGVIGRPVTLPEISEIEPPAVACAKIGAALGRPIPRTCAQIVLFPSSKLRQAQRVVSAFNGIRIGLLILTPLLAALALWASTSRRRTIMQLAVAGVVGHVIARRATSWLQASLVNSGRPENKAAREAILSQVLHGFFSTTLWIIVVLLLVFLVAFLCGPHIWARSVRRQAGGALRASRGVAVAVVSRGAEGGAGSWAMDHLAVFRLAGLAVAIIVVLAFSIPPIGVLVLAVLVVAYEAVLARLARKP